MDSYMYCFVIYFQPIILYYWGTESRAIPSTILISVLFTDFFIVFE
jgi:hypothetical protein